ncbi:MAG: AbrB/MazE/SpoVT family DNA-binding domain-containing protein [Actinomycetota bacterium]|nr:AbrB/MazE/SpoVT family DNA-binding domain-containing protein [Actinomycetota bacterium]
MPPEAKRYRKGFTRLSRKNQATLPVHVVDAAGLRPGDELQVRATGPGRVLLVRSVDRLDEFVGDLTGVYGPGYLEELRREWD